VVCTRAEAGAIALTGDGRWLEVAAQSVPEIVDTNGAGDAFLAGMVFAELQGLPTDAALVVAARVAALAVQSPDLAPAAVDMHALLAGLPAADASPATAT